MRSGWVGILSAELHFPEAHSLKEKRMVLRRVKDRLQKFNVAVADLYRSRFRRVPRVVYTAGVRHANNLAAPFRAITADMGNNFIIILFAVVVIGGLGSIVGAVVAGFLVGLVEAFGQAYAPTFAQILIFVLMAVVVLVRPAGLFGREEAA